MIRAADKIFHALKNFVPEKSEEISIAWMLNYPE